MVFIIRADHVDMTKKLHDPWTHHLAKDRERSAARRRAGREAGRPSSHQINAALAEALATVWAANVDRRAASAEIEHRREAIAIPVALDRVVEAAISILVARKRCDREIAGKAVIARVRPTASRPLRVPKAGEPLQTKMTSFS